MLVSPVPPRQPRARESGRGVMCVASSGHAFLVLKIVVIGKIFFWGSAPDPVMSDPTLDAPPRRSEGSSRPRGIYMVPYGSVGGLIFSWPCSSTS